MGGEPTHDPRSLGTDTVAAVMKGIAAAIDELSVAPDADAEVPEVSDVDDSDADSDGFVPWRDSRVLSWPDPPRALRLARRRLAHEARRRRARATHEFAAWWADVASVALADTARGVPVQAVRAAAGEPYLEMSDEDLPYLQERWLGSDEHVIVDRTDPDRRRDQLWGAAWTGHHVPSLPSVAELSEWLGICGVPTGHARAICQARQAIADALDAGGQVRASAEADSSVLQEAERTEHLTRLLVNYARLVTDGLRAVWSAAD